MPKPIYTLSRANATGLPFDGLPLFVWAAKRPSLNSFPTPIPRAARRIAQRFGLDPARARLVAELAGFQLENSLHV
jgi:hypothetical protein